MSNVRRASVWWMATAGALAPFACCEGSSPSKPFLGIQLITDLTPKREFTDVELKIDDSTSRTVRATATSFLDAQRVADFKGLAPSARRKLTVRLLDGMGQSVIERTVEFEHRSALTRTVVVTRSCLQVSCDEGRSCLGPACVDQRCLTGDEEACGGLRCTRDSDCLGSCRLCRHGTCLTIRDESLCPTDVEPADVSVDGTDEDLAGNAGVSDTTVDKACSKSLYGGHLYWLCPPQTWQDARDYCAANRAHLAVVESAPEGQHIAEEIDRAARDGLEKLHFMGLSDLERPGTYAWLGEVPVRYENWAASEPNNAPTSLCRTEDCGSIDALGVWRDVCCKDPRPFVCERD